MHATQFRSQYKLYDNKICTGDEAAECRYCMENRMKSIGYQVGRELLVDGRTAFDNNLIRKIQRQRAERADLRPALKDAVRAHIAVPAAVEQNVPVRALDEIG